jgi:hypothetical protein
MVIYGSKLSVHRLRVRADKARRLEEHTRLTVPTRTADFFSSKEVRIARCTEQQQFISASFRVGTFWRA